MATSSSRSVIIIGGGITGALTAWEFAKSGWTVRVLEARHIGAGSSSRTAAGIRQQFSTPSTVQGMRYSVSVYRGLAEQMNPGEQPIIQNGYLFLYDNETQWGQAQTRTAMQQAHGLNDVEAIGQKELHERFPFVNESLIGGTFCPTDGFLLPHLVYAEGFRLARQWGAIVEQNTEVIGGIQTNGRLTGVQTTKGVFEADLFIDCTNAWSHRLATALNAVDLPISPLKRYLWFVLRDGTMDEKTLGTMPLTVAPTGVYCRPENPNMLLMGKKHDTLSEKGFSYDDQDRIDPAFSHSGSIDAMPYEVWMELAEAIPQIGEFGGIHATTAGYYGTTPDHNPFLDYDPNISNLIRLVGFSGHGAMFGPFSAAIALKLAEAGRSISSTDLGMGADISIECFQIGREFEAHENMVI